MKLSYIFIISYQIYVIQYHQLIIINRICMAQEILKGKLGESYSISAQGLDALIKRPRDTQYPLRHISWTDDFTVELPIRKSQDGIGALEPTTLIDEFRLSSKVFANRPALSWKKQGKWETVNYAQYFNLCLKFAAGLMAYKFPQYTSVNIIGFNSPQWAIAFYGSLFARAIATGIYTTNSQQVCQFIAQNSDCKVIVSENMIYAKKYLEQLKSGQIKLIIIYNDPKINVSEYGGKIILWNDFMKEGERVDVRSVQKRMDKAKPGNCATLVYTSGTTGMPKGVMLSHDNFTWTKRSMDEYHKRDDIQIRLVSYLPLSHVAGLFADLITPVMSGYHVYFAQPDALQGTLIETLKQVRPVAFFSVPRVWQKIDEKMKQIAKQNGWLKTKIATWAKSLGPQGTLQQIRNQPTSFQFKLAKKLVFDQVKKQLGLDQCRYFLYGAAPLDPSIRHYFLSLNFFLINSYGMSESTGPQNFSNKDAFDYKNLASLREVGSNIPGTEIKIMKDNPRQQDGQICYRGRNIFMGYFKNPEESQKTFDENGYLHSGDMGKITKDNVLFITGRVKQLIITAGGQNIPPVLIENQIKAAMPYISNVMVVGQGKKYLNCLLTLKQDPPGSGKLEINCRDYLKSKNCDVTTVQQAIKHPNIRKIVSEGLSIANQKAISRAQKIHHFYILNQDFSVDNGALTPTLKLKRKQVTKKYAVEIQSMYINAKL